MKHHSTLELLIKNREYRLAKMTDFFKKIFSKFFFLLPSDIREY